MVKPKSKSNAWIGNPINITRFDSQISIGMNTLNGHMQFTPKYKHWFETVWRNWQLRQVGFFTQLPTVVGHRVRALDFNRPVGLFERNRNVRMIDLDKLVEHRSANPDAYYEVEIAGNWCVFYRAWQWKMLLQPTVDWWSVNTTTAMLNIFDWMRANPNDLPSDLTRLSADVAIAKSETWHKLLRNRELHATKSDPGTRLLVIPGVHKLLDANAVIHEGLTMHHCVDLYADQVVAGKTHIYHLDEPESTVQIQNGFMIQARGVCNAEVQLDSNLVKFLIQDSEKHEHEQREREQLDMATSDGDPTTLVVQAVNAY